MNNTRSQSNKTKYQLLLENSSSPLKVQNTLVVTVLVLSIVGATTVAVFLAWESLRAVEDTTFLLQMVERSSQKTFSTDKFQQRKYLYSTALRDSMHNISWATIAPNSTQISPNSASNQFKLVCYYTLPTGAQDLQPEKISPFLCTHINVGFAGVNNATVNINSSDEEIYRQVVALKSINPSLKVLLSVGGGGTDTGGFSAMVSSRNTRRSFIKSTLHTLSGLNFDGIDFDWEFPSWESEALDTHRFTLLLRELRSEIQEQKLDLLVTVAVAAPQPIVDKSYDIPAMAKYVDFVNVMSYDYHYYVWYLALTGANAPLYASSQENGYMRTLNANYTALYWNSKGMPAEKIVLGMPTYGHSFTLVNIDNNGLNAPASGNGVLGTDGFISYADACWFLSDSHATSVFDHETRVPYAYRGKEWISYDDERSLAYKAQYVVNSNLGGAMILSLNTDDFNGLCSKGAESFPLTRRVANVLKDDQL